MDISRSRASTGLGVVLATLLLIAGCAPANQRPLSGAVPGADRPTATAGVPPTLPVGSEPQLRALPEPSPGLAALASPSPSAAASPTPNPSPPIVRTIQPSNGAALPVNAPVALSAVLVGRGADLATATLTVDGADVGAEIAKTTAQQWTIAATRPLAAGAHTARVSVRDSTGANGGFTWQFVVGAQPTPTPEPASEPEATPTPVRRVTPPPAAPKPAAATPAPKPAATPATVPVATLPAITPVSGD